jgi:hypothetical protein
MYILFFLGNGIQQYGGGGGDCAGSGAAGSEQSGYFFNFTGN